MINEWIIARTNSMKLLENKYLKIVRSPNYNYNFNKKTGYFERWGKTEDDDPTFSPFGPEILDLEISTICNKGCQFCYKGNSPQGENMSYETFKNIFHKIPSTVTQIAYGIGDVDAHDQMFDIFEYTRKSGIIPNVTINGSRMTVEIAKKLAKVCGAVAVSHYDDDSCFNTIEMLSNAGLKQINIHKLLYSDYESCFDLIKKVKEDPRTKNLNAIVYLALKKKGRGINMIPLKDLSVYKKLFTLALEKDVGVGFDSCSAHNFLKAIKGHPKEKEYTELCEPCESTKFSIFCDVRGNALPCSFSSDIIAPINILQAENFIKDVWNSDTFINFRNKINSTCTSCILYDLDME